MSELVMEAEKARIAFEKIRDEVLSQLDRGAAGCSMLIDRLVEASDRMSEADMKLRMAG